MKREITKMYIVQVHLKNIQKFEQGIPYIYICVHRHFVRNVFLNIVTHNIAKPECCHILCFMFCIIFLKMGQHFQVYAYQALF